jgi:rubrerythrin
MLQISEKELSAMNDLLNEEELLVKKFKMLASHTEDKEIKAKFEEISHKHQGHFDMLYKQLG